MLIGVMGAMPQEVASLVDSMEIAGEDQRAMRRWRRGRLFDADVVLVHSLCGKVAAAATASRLILQYNVDRIVFTGLAGGVDPARKIGDVVVATDLIQHDLDARPLFPRFEVPLHDRYAFATDEAAREIALDAAHEFIRDELPSVIPPELGHLFDGDGPRVAQGPVLSGDQFICDPDRLAALRADLPGAQCVEMEGAAVAQVCYEEGIPLTVVRTISDTADHNAPDVFMNSLGAIAGLYARGLMKRYLPGVAAL